MDYSPYLAVCHDQSLPGVHAKFQWQDVVSRRRPTARLSDTTTRADDSKSRALRRQRDGQEQRLAFSTSWPCFATTRDFNDALDNIKNAITLHFCSATSSGGRFEGGLGTDSSGGHVGTKRKSTKKVSFADEMGFSLATVRTIESLLTLTAKNNIKIPVRSPQEPAIAPRPRFVLGFRQPWKSNEEFRGKLENGLVQLANIVIQDGIISGDILVRNLAYEKKVFVRYSGCAWSSYSDIYASFVSPDRDIYGRGTDRSQHVLSGFDTFSFVFPVPLEPEKEGRVEFAICYIVEGKTFWDNNGGRNYEVVKMLDKTPTAGDDWSIRQVVKNGLRNTTDSVVFNSLQTTSVVWTEFIGWKWGMDYTLPYW